jgi:hypothetical protein
MGSDAELYFLDTVSFQNDIVPGFHKLLTGQVSPNWLVHLIKNSDFQDMKGLIEEFRSDPIDLTKHCNYLSDLACIDPERFNFNLGRKPRRVWHLQYDNKDARRCMEKDCLETTRCPFYVDNSREIAELLNYLFGDTMAWLSEGVGVFVGRTTSPATYEEELTKLGVPEDSLLRELLDRLGTRGFIFGYGWANGDGVHGWLNPQECDELAQQLWQLELPEYSATPANLERWQPLNKSRSEQDWDRLVLAYIRAMAEYAAKIEQGIVWMNDVPMETREKYGPFREWLHSH